MTLTPIPRREFLTWSGIAGILAAGRAPAFAQGTTLHFLQWSHFVPAADTLSEAQAREFGNEAGFEYPKTWDEFRKVGRAFKTKGRPFGQAFGHSINDPNAWAYPIVWMWGGLEVQKDGRSVALNSKNTVEAVKFTLAVWKDCFDEGGLAWDDSTNNRAFLSQEISLTGNAPSIYIAARQKFPDVYKGTNHGHYPPGPAGRFYWLPCWNSCVMKYGKNTKVAKDFIRYYMDRAQFDRYFETMDTFGIPATRAYGDHPLWKKDPKTAVFPETLPNARP